MSTIECSARALNPAGRERITPACREATAFPPSPYDLVVRDDLGMMQQIGAIT
jgi:hypothetical protein